MLKFHLYYDLTFDGKGGLKPGHGDAGYTAALFATLKDAESFAERHRFRYEQNGRISLFDVLSGDSFHTVSRFNHAGQIMHGPWQLF